MSLNQFSNSKIKLSKVYSKKQFDFVLDFAFKQNRDLPFSYQSELFEEGIRVLEHFGPEATERKILLLGGAGYIGSVLTGHLLKNGYSVRCFDRLIYNNQHSILSYLNDRNYEFIYGDIVNDTSINSVLNGVTDVVILAGLVGDPITKKYPKAAQKINEEGISNVIQCLNGKGLNKVIFISTCSNYGLIEGDDSADESFTLKPLSAYAKAKVASEQKILSLQGRVDYYPTVLRFATAFGLSPRMRFDLTVSEFTHKLYKGAELVVYDAETWRPYCHVQDFSIVIRRVLEAPIHRVAFEVFNAGSDENNFTKQMLVDEIKKILPSSKIRYQEHGSDPRNYRVSFSKIKECLYFESSRTVLDNVNNLIGALQQKLFHNIESDPSVYGNHRIDYP